MLYTPQPRSIREGPPGYKSPAKSWPQTDQPRDVEGKRNGNGRALAGRIGITGHHEY